MAEQSAAADTTGITAGRPRIVGPAHGPEPPFPLKMEGKVISGFGRGSKELGIPTANLPVDAQTPWIDDVKSGVYFGWASLALPPDHPDRPFDGDTPAFLLYPMVMSIGYNPFYKNTVRSAEVHVLHPFTADFYGAHMRLLVLGFVREEKDYASLDALVEDIRFDCEVARESVRRRQWWPSPSPGVTLGLSVDGGDGVDGPGELDVSWLVRPLDG
ncbi:riboflavin kinase [Sodiomyces alkalinus F11]|uniref:Riboflavin kinase n=1 Tax=Sodiomyces alkalinus (strain CBS 110278 / VKM F-3762 / F11) TaxID=1314773 RepID=A0A3N2PQ09_SODAK|nr:riboflavin kinase [Sodiomyces alkalinus F11]ROT36588.1 riboflavin kinase [Sodiomyces alkalinus F11]